MNLLYIFNYNTCLPLYPVLIILYWILLLSPLDSSDTFLMFTNIGDTEEIVVILYIYTILRYLYWFQIDKRKRLLLLLIIMPYISYYLLANTYTVGTYSVGNSFFVYVMSMHVLPTMPSPTVVILIGLFRDPMFVSAIKQRYICVIRHLYIGYCTYIIHQNILYIIA